MLAVLLFGCGIDEVSSTSSTTDDVSPAPSPTERFTDAEAGLSYEVPKSWHGPIGEGEILFFSMFFTSQDPDSDAGSEGETVIDEQVEANGIHGWRVRLVITLDDAAAADATVDLVALGTSPPAYVVGLVSGDDEGMESELDYTMRNVQPAS